jgi:hypothetical protein
MSPGQFLSQTPIALGLIVLGVFVTIATVKTAMDNEKSLFLPALIWWICGFAFTWGVVSVLGNMGIDLFPDFLIDVLKSALEGVRSVKKSL